MCGGDNNEVCSVFHQQLWFLPRCKLFCIFILHRLTFHYRWYNTTPTILLLEGVLALTTISGLRAIKIELVANIIQWEINKDVSFHIFYFYICIFNVNGVSKIEPHILMFVFLRYQCTFYWIPMKIYVTRKLRSARSFCI